MTTTTTARFEAEYGLRTGPKITDYVVMAPGECIELTDDLRARNKSSGVSIFDLAPDVQQREFGRVICRVGDDLPASSTDSRAMDWYAPLDDVHSIPVTSYETVYYRGSGTQ